MGQAGFNCSLPHKTTVISHLDGLAPSAQIIGAVNCVVRRGGDLIGENTDGQGFLAALRTVTDPAGRNVVLLGAGGAARAIAVEVALAGAASITVVNRGQRRGEDLAELIRGSTPTAAHFVPWTAFLEEAAAHGCDAGRPGHAGQPGSDQHRPLDRGRRRPSGHAPCPR